MQELFVCYSCLGYLLIQATCIWLIIFILEEGRIFLAIEQGFPSVSMPSSVGIRILDLASHSHGFLEVGCPFYTLTGSNSTHTESILNWPQEMMVISINSNNKYICKKLAIPFTYHVTSCYNDVIRKGCLPSIYRFHF